MIRSNDKLIIASINRHDKTDGCIVAANARLISLAHLIVETQNCRSIDVDKVETLPSYVPVRPFAKFTSLTLDADFLNLHVLYAVARHLMRKKKWNCDIKMSSPERDSLCDWKWDVVWDNSRKIAKNRQTIKQKSKNCPCLRAWTETQEWTWRGFESRSYIRLTQACVSKNSLVLTPTFRFARSANRPSKWLKSSSIDSSRMIYLIRFYEVVESHQPVKNTKVRIASHKHAVSTTNEKLQKFDAIWRKTWHHDDDAVLYRSSEHNPARSHSTRHLWWASFSLSLSRASAGSARERHNQQHCETHKTFRSTNAGAKHTQRISPKKYSALIGVHERGLTWFIFIWSVERWTSSPSISSVKVIGKSRARQPRITRGGGGRKKGEKKRFHTATLLSSSSSQLCLQSAVLNVSTSFIPSLSVSWGRRFSVRCFRVYEDKRAHCVRTREAFPCETVESSSELRLKKSDKSSKVSIHRGSRRNRLLRYMQFHNCSAEEWEDCWWSYKINVCKCEKWQSWKG